VLLAEVGVPVTWLTAKRRSRLGWNDRGRAASIRKRGVELLARSAAPGCRRPRALALRYAGLPLVYLSSTAGLFLTGPGHGMQLVIPLGLLSAAGVLLSTLLRVRAFRLLGVTFLSLDVFAQIWHAAVDRAQTWVWWASGIVLGAAILTLFALFEERRHDVLKALDALRRWR
jgi:hypothetical protein